MIAILFNVNVSPAENSYADDERICFSLRADRTGEGRKTLAIYRRASCEVC